MEKKTSELENSNPQNNEINEHVRLCCGLFCKASRLLEILKSSPEQYSFSHADLKKCKNNSF
jgi:hypothetical protein